MDRYIIIIGAMKSGTTTLFSMLAQHPQIAPASSKEPGYFAFEEMYSKGPSWFKGLFNFNSTQHTYRMEASTDYTKFPFVSKVWERMKAEPNATFKLIYIMRHPLRRIESHARHTQVTQKEIGQTIMSRSNQSLDQAPTLLNISTSQYARQIDIYREAWEAGQLFLTTLEELRSDPAVVAEQLASFLEIEVVPQMTTVRHENPAKNQRKVDPRWAALTKQPFLKNLGKKLVPKHIRQGLKEKFTRETVVEGRFVLTGEEEAALLGLLQDDLVRLQSQYGVDTRAHWDLG